MPRVSVILPVFNRETSVRRAVDSVLRQTFDDFELLVVDDCSTDESVAALATIHDHRLSVIRCPENRGVAAARNVGLAHARGEWIAFQDSDDEWLPRKLELQLALAGSSEYVAIYCGMLILNTLRVARRVQRPAPRYIPASNLKRVAGDLSVELLRRSLISTQTLLVRNSLITQLGGFDRSLKALVDWELAIRIAQVGPIGLVDSPLVLQEFSANSITRNVPARLDAQSIVIEKHAGLYAHHPKVLGQLYYGLSGGYRSLNQLADALTHMEAAIEVCPRNLRYRLMYGWLNAARLLRTLRI